MSINIEKKRERNRRYCTRHPDKVRARRNRSYWKNHDQELQRLKEKRLSKSLNPGFRLSEAISASMRQALKNRKNGHRWEILTGYTLEQLMNHLQSQFKPGMTWENYGQWEIDHKRPICSFKFQTFNDFSFKECWDLSNLQPLWAKENRIKGKETA